MDRSFFEQMAPKFRFGPEVELAVPMSVTDEYDISKHFCEEFYRRYPNHPKFFIGTFQQAIGEAFYGNSKDKILAMYVHHDESIFSNIFCLNILSSDGFIDTAKNIILWGWDISNSNHKNMLEHIIINSVGLLIKDTIFACLQKHDLPAFIVFTQGADGSVQMHSISFGNVTTIDEFMALFSTAFETSTKCNHATTNNALQS